MSTLAQELGISLSAFQPLSDPYARYIRELDNEITGYSHTIDSFGGYGQGSISMSSDRYLAEEWYREGLGRRIVSYDHAQNEMYEAFVNQITIRGSGLSVSIGPLLEITNRCRCAYTTKRYNTNPPIGGQSALTAETEDTSSIARYGILYSVVNGGELLELEADAERDTYLYNNREPKSDQDVETPGGSPFSIELSLAGYSAYMERYTYRQIGLGMQDLSEKLKSIIQFDPNDYLSDNFLFVQDNPFQVPFTDDDEREALSIVKELVSKGDGTGARWLFGIYQSRMAHFRSAPTTIKYTYSIEDPSQQIYERDIAVRPWNVVPGEWMRVSDLIMGEPVPVDPRRDKRNLFIESVTYTMPYAVSVNGAQLDKLAQAIGALTGIIANS